MTQPTRSDVLGHATGSETAPGEPLSFPASFAQHRLWFLDQLDPGSGAYNLPLALRLEGPLDAGALEASFNEILRRHDVLRTSFPVREGIPVQVVSPHSRIGLHETDLRQLPVETREREASRLASAEGIRPFDLAAGPVIRATMIRMAEEDHVLILTMHHIVSDGWSLDVLKRELAVLYGAFRAGEPSPLPELPIQYADYAISEREWLRGDVLDAQLSYWKEQLRGIPALLELPTDYPRAAVQSTRGSTLTATLPPDLLAGLNALARSERATLFMTLLAAFHALLFRYTGQQDIPVGSPIAGRTQVETEGLIGFFVNTLVLRGNLSGDPTFRQLLARVREATLGAYAHQELPFEKLVEELQPARALSQSPLFQVMFQFISPTAEESKLPGLRVRPFPLKEDVAKFDLSFRVIAREESLACSFEFNRDLFDAETIRRLLDHWRTLLSGIVSDPDRPVSQLSLLTDAERRQTLALGEGREECAPAGAVHQLFHAQASTAPDAIALVSDAGERLTYRKLDERANRLAHYLVAQGVGPDVPVGVCLARSADAVTAILGILKAGGAYLPLDPTYPAERLEFMLRDSGARLLLTLEAHGPRLRSEFVQVILLDRLEGTLRRQSSVPPEVALDPANLAYLIYTSGSTGKPKGVMVSHRALSNHMHWFQTQFAISGEDRVVQRTPLSFDASVWELFLPLITGAQLIVAEAEAHRDTAALVRSIRRNEATVVQAVPPLLGLLLEEPELPLGSSLRHVFCGGGPLPAALQQRFFERSTGALHNLYGPTEATIDASFWTCRRQAAGEGTVPIGKPIANSQIYVLDDELEPAPIGVPGELYIGGRGLARGYANNPELTAEAFIPNPFAYAGGDRLYRTGDRGRQRPDGTIVFLGRGDDQAKIRGQRVEPGEIETALLRHPAIREVAVVVRPDKYGDSSLIACLVTHGGEPVEVEVIRDFLRRSLPPAMIPAAFVQLATLPRTPSGKIDRSALLAAVRERSVARRGTAMPRDPLETRIAAVWEKVLGVAPVGIHDNFFDLGGHSFLAVAVFSEIEKAFGRRLPLATLFQAPTVGEIAAILREEGAGVSWSSLVPISPGGSKPPFYCVHAVGGNVLTYFDLARHLGPAQPVYGLQAKGLDGKQAPHGTIEEMAAYYLREIRQFQPEGPYSLGGSSAGGLVAFEMARQLHAQGQQIGVLALFDTWGPDYPRPMPGMTPLRLRVSRFVERVDLHLGNFLIAEGVSGKLDYVLTKSQRLRNALGQKGRRYWRKLREIPQGILDPLPAALRRVEKKSRRAIDIYVPKAYPGRVTLFRATKQPAGIYPDSELGWSRVAGGGVEVHEVPGYHGAIVYEPRIKVLAEQLRLCLEKAHDHEALEGAATRKLSPAHRFPRTLRAS